MKENGNVPNVSAERLNLVMKTSYKVNSILKVGASMFANRRKNSSYLPDSDGLTNPIFYSRLANPYFTPYNEHGNYNYDIDVENDVDMDFGFNPFEELKNTTNETTINGLSSIFDAELRFDDRFKFTTQLGLQLDKTSIEKIADAYAKVAYTADKALGGKRYDESRKQLENLAEQQILIQKQINEEQSKKKTDHGKIEEWQRQIQEIAQEMASIINEMLEDIIGYTAADLASELGDAFFEAAKQGEDAMEAWRKKVNDIVADVLQRMLVQKYLEERIGGIFDRYKKEWFGNDGSFKGIDAVIGSMNGFAGELNQVGEEFNAIYQGLSDSLKNYFTGDAEREGTSKGITSESQDSAFERNARLTTIQGHTYTLVQGMNDLNRTGNAVLDKLTGIEKNTSETNDKLDKVDKSIKDVKNMVDEIDRKGLKLRS